MSNQETFHQPPVAHGIEHGPYLDEQVALNDSQSYGLEKAIDEAFEEGRISPEQHTQGYERVKTLVDQEYNQQIAESAEWRDQGMPGVENSSEGERALLDLHDAHLGIHEIESSGADGSDR
jgi:hypothetical protein